MASSQGEGGQPFDATIKLLESLGAKSSRRL